MDVARTPAEHRAATLQALLVTFLWSTSWVLIRWGLRDLPPLTFAGLRYGLASALLLGVAALRRRGDRPPRPWADLVLLGLVFYAATQGAQFVALSLLPAATVSLFLSATPLLAAVASILWLREPPRRLQWVGAGVLLLGAAVYLGASVAPSPRALAVALFAVTANAAAAVLGRRLFRSEAVEPLDATGIAMAVGAAALLVVGTLVEPRPRLSGQAWGILGWLAVVNTAFAFWLWSRTQRRLTATESSVLNNTMLLQIALLAWLFLGEPLSGREVLGLLGVAAGAALVQWRPRRA